MSHPVTERPEAVADAPVRLGPARTPWWAVAARWVLIAAAVAACAYLAQRAIDAGDSAIVAVAAFIAMAVLVIYSTRRFVPAKYLFPGLILLLLFQLYPVAYTAATAFTNRGTGHEVTKQESIEGNQATRLTTKKNSPRFQLTYAVREGEDPATGKPVMLLSVPKQQGESLKLPKASDNTAGKHLLFVGDADGIKPLPAKDAKVTGLGKVVSVPGYRPIAGGLGNRPKITVPTDEGRIMNQTLGTAFFGESTLRYDQGADTITDTSTGQVYVAKDATWVPRDGKGDPLPIGWEQNVGFSNFKTVLSDPEYRDSFLRVFAWNFAFAFLSVATTFLLGMALALLFNDPRIKLKGLWRSILILPYAIPSFVTALVWAGMFNQDYGLINSVLPVSPDWLGDPWLAKVAVLLTNLWLGFPYMFLICTGALQSIPGEVREAAAIDGASPFRTVRSIIMPLLLVAVGPLLVASFAFNFNNFSLIYMLTHGGPKVPGEKAGATDLLITFAYQTSEEQHRVGIAAALAVVIFFIVGLISLFGFRSTKTFEDVN